MKTASILTVSLIFVAFNGVACLSKRENAIKELREYIKQVESCSEHDPKGVKLWQMLRKFGMEGVMRFSCGHSSKPSIHLYYILWRYAANYNPLRLAERVIKDLSLQTAIDELKKKYLDKHKKPDEQALFKLLGDFTKRELMSKEKVNYYKKELGDGFYSDANELAKQVLKDLRFQTAIEDLKDFQIEYGLGMSLGNGLGLYGLLQRFKVQELISFNIFKEYEKKIQDGEDVARIACAVLTHLKTELSKSLVMIHIENAIKELEGYIKEVESCSDYDPKGVKLGEKLSKFHMEDVISKLQLDSYEIRIREFWYIGAQRIAGEFLSDIHLQKAIVELKKYLKAIKKPDKNILFKLLGDFKKEGVIKEENFNNYEKLLKDGNCSDANNLAKKVLKDLRIQKAIDELKDFQDIWLFTPKKPDDKALFKLFDKFKRQGLISREKYEEYEGMLLDLDLINIACVAGADLMTEQKLSPVDCK